MKILCNQEFNRVDWEMVYETLNNVPQLFQVWACKQGLGIACPVEWDRSVVRKCRSCTIARDTCKHVLHCRSEGRVETLQHTLDLTEEWLEDKETDTELMDCMMELAHGRGRKTMGKICEGLDQRFICMAKEQDSIGWRRFMEGMICKSMRRIQTKYHYWEGTTTNPA